MMSHRQCEHCNLQFDNAIKLGLHRRSVHGQQRIYRCDCCDKVCSSSSALCYHRKVCKIRLSNIESASSAYIDNAEANIASSTSSSRSPTILCGLCDVAVEKVSELCSHLTEVHGISAPIEKLQFSSTDDFEKWKLDIEQRGHFEFVCKNKRDYKNSTAKYLYCHRSGVYVSESSGQRATKKLGSIKAGFWCSTFAVATTEKLTVRTALGNQF